MTGLDPGITALIIGVSFLVLMLTGFPVAFAMLSISILGYLVFVGPQALYTIFPVAFNTLTSDIFIAVPLFVFMASVFQVSGIGERMYDSMYKWMAGLKGGLAIGTVIICSLIAAITGLVATGTVLMGLLAYPEMRKRGYEKKMAIGPIIAGGTLGPLIPPSVPMIIVGGLGGISTGKLFISGIFPGLLCAFFFVLYVGIKCSLNPKLGPPIPLAERAQWKEKLVSTWGLLAPIVLIILVLGGIYSGVFTPMEAGGIGAVGALICAVVFRNLNWKNLSVAAMTTFKASAMVMWLTLTGGAFASLCGITGIKTFIGGLLAGLPLPSIGIMLTMLIIVFIMGMFIDSVAIIMITLPIMFPVAQQLGYDLLLFSLLFTLCVIIGMLTPPFGYALFYFKGIGHQDVSMKDIYDSSVPYVFLMLIVLGLCIVFPQIPLWLPNKMIK